MKPYFLIFPALFLLVACNRAPDDVASGSTELPEVGPAAVAPAVGEPAQVAELTLTPVKTEDCKPGRYTAEISWVIPASQPYTDVEVRVSKPDGGLMAFKKSRKSTAMTGNWVSSGAQFFLVDRATKTVLGKVVAGEYDCE